MKKKQFLWDFCSASSANSELLTTKRDKNNQKVFFYTNLTSKMCLMENLGSLWLGLFKIKKRKLIALFYFKT